MKNNLPTAQELLDAIGPAKLAQRLNKASSGDTYTTQRVHNWRKRGVPAAVQLEHGELLKKIAKESKHDHVPA